MICLLFQTLIIICSVVLLLTLFIIGKRSVHSKRLMAVIGSGGHTAEMLTLVKTLLDSTDVSKIKNLGESMIEEVIFVVSDNDQMSRQKLLEAFPQLNDDAVKSSKKASTTSPFTFQMLSISRSRRVHQSYLSSVWTTLRSCLAALPLIYSTRPGMLLCNGPGVCIPLVFASRLLSRQSLVIFVESFCRTRTLSLSGKIVYHLRLADHFLVQWPKLVQKYPRSQYLGGFLV